MITFNSGGGNDLTAAIFLVLSVIVPWLIVYSVRVAVGPLQRPMIEPLFRADARRQGETALLELRNVRRIRAFHVTATWRDEDSEIATSRPTLDPGVSMSWEAPIPSNRADDDIYWLIVKARVPWPTGNRQGAWYVPVYLAPVG